MKPVKCTVKYFCFGSLMIFIGSVLLCSLGITIVLPYFKTKNWVKVDCEVLNAAYNPKNCSCDQHESRTDCTDVYPCLQITVMYNYTGDRGKCRRGPVIRLADGRDVKGCYFEINGSTVGSYVNGTGGVSERSMNRSAVHTATLYKTWSDSFYKTCSLHVCDQKQWNNKEADRFDKTWGQRHQKYACYADPLAPDSVILEKLSYNDCVHAIVWPVLCLTFGMFVWGGLYIGCWVIESKDKNYCPQRTYVGGAVI